MTDKTEAQPEALRLADRLEDFALALPAYGFDDQPPKEAATELRRQHAESERLTAALKKANDQAEQFEREWYLRGDEIELLKAQLSARAVPGWKLVPVEMTNAMGRAGQQERRQMHSSLACVYRAMLSAAPPPPEREPLTEDQWQALADALDGIINRELKNKISAILQLPTE